MNSRIHSASQRPLSRRGRQAPSLIAISFAFVLIMCLAVTMGYLVTKQIIYPYILKQDLPIAEGRPSPSGVVIDENEVPPAAPPAAKDSVIDGGAAEPAGSPAASGGQGGIAAGQSAASAGGIAASQSAASAGGIAAASPPAPPSAAASAVPAGFCLQYGSLSTRDAADALVSSLQSKGIKSSVTEADGRFKVIGETYAAKEDAKAHLPAISLVVPDVFVTALP